MTDLTTYQQQLPSTIEDIAHFLLIAPEKATALRAEIRAIQKIGLAKEVYDQKLDEQRRLCDMILDASVRLGEMTKQIPKATSGNQYTGKMVSNTADTDQKSKSEVINDLGFSKMQVQRFETLADNKDLVEQEKATAREDGRMPTRTNVLDLAEIRNKRNHEEFVQIDRDFDNLRLFRRVAQYHDLFELENNFDEIIASVVAVADDFTGIIDAIDEQISILSGIKQRLILKKGEKR